MTHKVFVDTNVILDFVFKRKRFVANATKLLELARQRKIRIYISSISVSTIHYLVKKNISKAYADDTLRQLIPIVKVLPVHESAVKDAMLSDFKDFEDALQNYCAEEAKLTHIITRNPDDFTESKLSIFAPEQYLKATGEL